ncbi:hypothetical protein [Gracilibacillus xinjiangensis]|uniref:Uncharacterized protein n=1 Tax=Gracilibacillus xinjiangensis TaxID=1193282 RepID=A0ABV8WY40_9BACI
MPKSTILDIQTKRIRSGTKLLINVRVPGVKGSLQKTELHRMK